MSPVRSASPARVVAVVIVTAAVVVGAVAVPAAGRAPPRPVCDLCADGALANAAAERGVELETDRSTLDVRVFENASTRWVVRVDLTAGADDPVGRSR